MEAKIYNITDTLNSKVNFQKLDLEIRASGIDYYVTPVYQLGGDKIFVEFTQTPTVEHVTTLDAIIAAHDGEDATTSEILVNQREIKIRELTQMGLYHPLLDDVELVEYLTSIDNWFNSWKRSGVNTVLVNKIQSDGTSGSHPQDAFLNQPVDTEGNTTYQFLISKISE